MAFKENGLNVSAIARKINRSRTVVNNFLQIPETYGKPKWPARPPELTPTCKRRLLREASKGNEGLKALIS